MAKPSSKGRDKKLARKAENERASAAAQLVRELNASAAGNPLTAFPALAAYNRRGLAAELRFYTPGELPPGLQDWALALTRLHMQDLYDACPGWAWSDAKKRAELAHPEARLVVALQQRQQQDGAAAAAGQQDGAAAAGQQQQHAAVGQQQGQESKDQQQQQQGQEEGKDKQAQQHAAVGTEVRQEQQSGGGAAIATAGGGDENAAALGNSASPNGSAAQQPFSAAAAAECAAAPPAAAQQQQREGQGGGGEACVAGQPLAFMHYRWEVEGGEAVCYLYEIQVEQQAQGKGLGRYLLQLLELGARKGGAARLMLTELHANETASALYRKLGYVLDDDSPGAVDAGGDHMYEIMTKRLKPRA